MIKKLGLILTLGAFFFTSKQSHADLWCTAYYPGYEQAGMPASAIDFTAVTHIVHFALLPETNGTLNTSVNVITQSGITNLIALAHQAGKKVLICIGGESSDFSGVSNSTYLNNLVANLTSFMYTNGYDGVDLDWEPVAASDQTNLTNLIVQLRASLNTITPRPLLTIAMPDTSPHSLGASILSGVKNDFDQINIQTYDLSGPYPGWFTWFNSPIFDGGTMFPGGGSPPSIDGIIDAYLTSGFTAAQLGLGIPFEGHIWSGGVTTSNSSGVSLPRQQWATAPSYSAGQPYKTLVTEYSSNLYVWDTNAQAAYYSVANQGANNQFVSFDDTRAVQSKISYARNNGLGGVILFELADDHFTSGPDPLLEAIKQALATPGAMTIQRNGSTDTISYTSAPLGEYNIQWSSNLMSAAWNTLLLTNETGLGGLRYVNDSIAPGQTQRFYRVKTPP
jgi:chitinase